MRELERAAIEDYGVPSIVLMENAARQTADLIEARLGKLKGKRILIFAGKGNNGGDGLAVARYMSNRGAAVRVLFFGNPEANQGDAKINREIIEKLDRSSTVVDVVGGYTGDSKKMLMVSFKVNQYSELLNIIHKADKNAFVTIHQAHEISGEGWTR
jgi:NAD(P)H-hydrate epimerase